MHSVGLILTTPFNNTSYDKTFREDISTIYSITTPAFRLPDSKEQQHESYLFGFLFNQERIAGKTGIG